MAERPVVYLLPGLLCDASVWAHQQQALSPAFEVRIADFRGFDDLREMARSVLAEAPERFSLAGHSMGARVALEIYAQAPQRVERLALLDTGVHPPGEAEPAKRQAMIDLAYAEGMAGLTERWLPPMVHPDRQSDAAFMAPLRAMVARMTPEIHEGQMRALLDRPDAASVLARITCPVLIGVGDSDAWSPPAQHEAMARAIPHARLVIFPHSGHMAPVETPAAVAAALRDWLETPSPA